MPDRPGHFHRHRYPAEIIAHAVWLYHRFALSFREVEELLFEPGVVVSYETVRAWAEKFGARFAADLHRREKGRGGTWYLDEVFVRIRGKQAYLWRAVDERGRCWTSLCRSAETPRRPSASSAGYSTLRESRPSES